MRVEVEVEVADIESKDNLREQQKAAQHQAANNKVEKTYRRETGKDDQPVSPDMWSHIYFGVC